MPSILSVLPALTPFNENGHHFLSSTDYLLLLLCKIIDSIYGKINDLPKVIVQVRCALDRKASAQLVQGGVSLQ